MAESATENHRRRPAGGSDALIERLLFAAVTEQRRARRWRVFFMLFFIVYLTVVTLMLIAGRDDRYGPAGAPDGDKHTALVRVSGLIASGEDAGAETVIKGLRKAFEHADTAGVILEINSPGGSPVQAAQIFDEVRRLRAAHVGTPLYAVVTDVAASGGYYVAAAADRIYADKSSLVGSIGVRLDAFGFVELMNKLGIERRLLTAGENKALFDPFLPEQETQKAHLQTMLDQVHTHFIDAVREGRGDRLDDDASIFSGLIWSGETALDLGLVDAYGSRHSVARELEAEDIVDFTPQTDILSRIADRIGASIGRGLGQSLGSGWSLN